MAVAECIDGVGLVDGGLALVGADTPSKLR